MLQFDEKVNTIEKLNWFLNYHAIIQKLDCDIVGMIEVSEENQILYVDMDCMKVPDSFITLLSDSLKKYKVNSLYHTEFNF